MISNSFDTKVVDVIPNVYSFAVVKNVRNFKLSELFRTSICYSVDADLVYEPFFGDFGPLNYGKAYKYFCYTKELLKEAKKRDCRLCLYSGPQQTLVANAAVLVGMFQVLGLGRTGEQAWQVLAPLGPFLTFRDACCGVALFGLRVQHCISGVAKAHACGFLNWTAPDSHEQLEEYSFYERVENGDLTWILPGKLLAFSGPAATSRVFNSFRTRTPEDYWDYFRLKGVTTVVRLNNQVYDAQQFTRGGFKLQEMYFPDGTCPSQDILSRFLELAENEPGALAVHCKAGLGRTGVLICSYLIKHYGFTGEEAIGYIRVVRPGSVIAQQQLWLLKMAPQLAQEGIAYRRLHQRPPSVYLKPTRGPGVQIEPCDTSEDDDSSCTMFEDGQLRHVDQPGDGIHSPTVHGETEILQRDVRVEESFALSANQALETSSTKQALSSFFRLSTSKTNLPTCLPTAMRRVTRRLSSLTPTASLSDTNPQPPSLGNTSSTSRTGSLSIKTTPSRTSSISPYTAPAHTPSVLTATARTASGRVSLPSTPAAFLDAGGGLGLAPSDSGALGGFKRCVAPNGQPRKIPAALFGLGDDVFGPDEEAPGQSTSDWTIGARPGAP